MQKFIKLIECPRDAMQGWPHLIPTAKKIAYLNQLLKVGFDTIDFGSFVSPKAIPQMADTKEVLKGLDLSHTQSKLLAIVANTRGAEEAVHYEQISYLGFPFSISATFQQRNTNSSIEAAFKTVEEMQTLCNKHQKQLIVYISMGFGNPYGDPYSEEIVFDWANKLNGIGVTTLSLADTVGVATADQISTITSYIIPSLPQVEIGVHLHSSFHHREEKTKAALQSGCLRFDGAIKGIGGCPMAGDNLVGNMDTVWMTDYFSSLDLMPQMDKNAFDETVLMAADIFI